jgi:hypothetical protein
MAETLFESGLSGEPSGVLQTGGTPWEQLWLLPSALRSTGSHGE